MAHIPHSNICIHTVIGQIHILKEGVGPVFLGSLEVDDVCKYLLWPTDNMIYSSQYYKM